MVLRAGERIQSAEWLETQVAMRQLRMDRVLHVHLVGARFGGAWFHIEAVYQRTVAELQARGSVFWLAFVPLACDVDEEKQRQIVEEQRNKLPWEHFDELMERMRGRTR